MATQTTTRGGIERQIKLPNREAIRISLRSLKIRFWRSLITTAGIVLAIAFFTAVMTSSLVEKGALDGADRDAALQPEKAATKVWLICISLIVCVVGIANAMLMSVTERFREIGTMKCLGALDWFIIKLFLIEAAFQGLVGSAVGAVAGFAAAILAGMSQYDQVWSRLPWDEAFLSLGFAVAVGVLLSIVGAIYPAYRAGKMPPADAMRTEI